jgi:hypothetical protein
VASGTVTVNGSCSVTYNPGPGVQVEGTCTVCSTCPNGDFCFPAYEVQPDDWGEYKVDVDGGKSDNYRVSHVESDLEVAKECQDRPMRL